MEGFSLFVIFLAVLVVIMLMSGVKSVPQGREYAVQRLGKYTRTLTPGLNLIIPFVDSIGAKTNKMKTVLDAPSQEIITRDNVMVKVDDASVIGGIAKQAFNAQSVTGFKTRAL